MGRLESKVAFVTGIARGQGRSHAVHLAREGADVIGLDLLAPMASMSYPLGTEEELAETVRLVEETGRRILARRADVRDRDAVRGVLKEGLDAFGRLDVVVANAAVSPPGAKIWEISDERWRDVIDTNLTGVFHTLAEAVPHLLARRDGGSIIVVSSGAGLRGVPNLGDYVATKMGVIGLAQSLANEVAHRGIRVNAVCPGTVNTPMVTANVGQFRMFRPDLPEPTLADCQEVFTSIMPMRQPWIEPADVSRLVVFLASDDSRYLTGAVLPIDQGSANRV